MRAKLGVLATPMAMTAEVRPGPRIEMMPMASRMPGSASSTSNRRMIRSSKRLPA